ncbi:STAS domain-containing protein [Actinoplanes sp. NPDC051851]|uniref:STAS domain-containing protein n=1 Tax=Actinoplanes sp. NPDC051851 TaxID=3154753 RepID=UPI00343914DC
MTNPLIRLDQHNGVAVVAIRGMLDASAVPMIRDVLGWAVTHHDDVIVNLSAATGADRNGVSVLLSSLDRAHSRAVRLRLRNPSRQLVADLRALRAEHLLSSVSSLSDAAVRIPDQPGGFSLPSRGEVFPLAG